MNTIKLNIIQLFTTIILFCVTMASYAYANETLMILDIFESMYQGKYDLHVPDYNTNENLPLYIVLPGGVNKKYTAFRDELIVPGLKHQKELF